MHLLFRLFLFVPLIAACDPPTPPSAPTFEASSPKPLTEPTIDALGTREDGLGLPVGAAIPPFEIQDFRGEVFSSTAINDANTLVVFYRGGWCPFCNFQIRELGQSHDEFKALGVSLVAISVDQPDAAAVTRNAYEVPFPVLSDPHLKAHEAFNVVLQLDAAGVARLAKYGHDIEPLDRARNDCAASLELRKKPVTKAVSEKPLDSVTSPNDFLVFVGRWARHEFLERALLHVVEIVLHGRL
jgi:peroxiredoxin